MAQVITDDDIDFAVYENETNHRRHVRPARLYVLQLLERVANPVKEKRVYMPWFKTRKLIHFRPGEVTCWGGPNGSGKSLLTGMCAVSMCAQDEKVCIASFELKPEKSLERMARQWTHRDIYDEAVMADPAQAGAVVDLYQQFGEWTDGRLWFYDQQGTVQWKQVCAVVRYAAKELGVTQFFVDSLMKCVQGEDDYNGQKAFVDELTAIARDHGIHIHLVHHIKKPANEDAISSKYDFKGTGAITDQVDNVIVVWRNKKKERDRQAHKAVAEGEHDTKLLIDKQRHGTGWEGQIGLWFHGHSQQFLGAVEDHPMTLYRREHEAKAA